MRRLPRSTSKNKWQARASVRSSTSLGSLVESRPVMYCAQAFKNGVETLHESSRESSSVSGIRGHLQRMRLTHDTTTDQQLPAGTQNGSFYPQYVSVLFLLHTFFVGTRVLHSRRTLWWLPVCFMGSTGGRGGDSSSTSTFNPLALEV